MANNFFFLLFKRDGRAPLAVAFYSRFQGRPKLNMDGGSVELVDLAGTVVKVRLLGMCSGCMGAAGTLKHLVEKALQEKVDPSLTVEQN